MSMTCAQAAELGLEPLYDEVKELEDLKHPDAIIEQLKSIMKILITQYNIKIGPYVFEPLWVEAYYYRTGIFEDENCHKKIDQYNRFGKLYFQPGKAGIDVCLSNGDYCLSFLIKNVVIRQAPNEDKVGKFLTQYGVAAYFDLASRNLNRDGYYLVENDPCEKSLETPVFFERKGLTKIAYKDTPLAIVKNLRDFKITGKEKKAVLYIEQELSSVWESMSENEKKQLSKTVLGYELKSFYNHKLSSNK